MTEFARKLIERLENAETEIDNSDAEMFNFDAYEIMKPTREDSSDEMYMDCLFELYVKMAHVAKSGGNVQCSWFVGLFSAEYVLETAYMVESGDEDIEYLNYHHAYDCLFVDLYLLEKYADYDRCDIEITKEAIEKCNALLNA